MLVKVLVTPIVNRGVERMAMVTTVVKVSLMKVTCRAGSNAANSRQSCSQRTASLRRDRAWSGEDGYQNVEPVKVLMGIMILYLTSSAISPLCPYVLLPPWPQTSPWLCFKNKFLFFCEDDTKTIKIIFADPMKTACSQLTAW